MDFTHIDELGNVQMVDVSEKKVTKSKSGNLLTDLDNKYKEIRKKLAPKTGEEYWKKYKEKKANEN